MVADAASAVSSTCIAFLEARAAGCTASWLDFHERPSLSLTGAAWVPRRSPARRFAVVIAGVIGRAFEQAFLLQFGSDEALPAYVRIAIVHAVLSYLPISDAPPPLRLDTTCLDTAVTTAKFATFRGPWGASLVRPPPPLRQTIPALYIRVLTPTATFGAEELNTLYGRFGFLKAVRLDPATGCAARAPPSAADRIAIPGWKPLYRLHFAITFDSFPNAEGAIQDVRGALVDFAAFAIPVVAVAADEADMTDAPSGSDAESSRPPTPASDPEGVSVTGRSRKASTRPPLSKPERLSFAEGPDSSGDGSAGRLPPMPWPINRLTSSEDILSLFQKGHHSFKAHRRETADALARDGGGGTDDRLGRTQRSADDELQSFVPDLVIDGVPFHVTPDQLREFFGQHGTVVELRLSIDDRSGVFLGCALVRMASFDEAVRACESMNGQTIGDDEVVCGVLDQEFNIVSPLDPTEVRYAPDTSRSVHVGSAPLIATPGTPAATVSVRGATHVLPTPAEVRVGQR